MLSITHYYGHPSKHRHPYKTEVPTTMPTIAFDTLRFTKRLMEADVALDFASAQLPPKPSRRIGGGGSSDPPGYRTTPEGYRANQGGCRGTY